MSEKPAFLPEARHKLEKRRERDIEKRQEA
jgi:hypothetical protein